MKIKTSELTGPALDWAVAKCEGFKPHAAASLAIMGDYSPSIKWHQGGPIIDRIKGFEFKQWLEAPPNSCCEAHIHNYDGDWIAFGPTFLIAAMRCFVSSHLGDEVEIPENLK